MPRSHSFGNPRYQRGEDSSSSPVNELAALAQIFSGLQAPQQRQQEARQQQALQFLQLMQQGSHQDDVLSEQRKYHQQELSGAQDARNITATGDAARMDMLGHQVQEDSRHHQALETAASTQNENQMKHALMQGLMNDQTIPLAKKQAALSVLDPTFKSAMGAMDQAGTQMAIDKAAPVFRQRYAAAHNDPSKLQVTDLKDALPTDVYNGQDWTGMNQGMAAIPVAPPASGLTGRTGGIINSLFPDNRPPGAAELQQQDSNNTHLSDMFSWLIGERPEAKLEKQKSAAAWEALHQQYPNHPFFTR